jgi:hypothetical protein
MYIITPLKLGQQSKKGYENMDVGIRTGCGDFLVSVSIIR